MGDKMRLVRRRESLRSEKDDAKPQNIQEGGGSNLDHSTSKYPGDGKGSWRPKE